MSDEEMIRALLSSAGMIMEDSSAKLILAPPDSEDAVTELRQAIRELATLIEIIDVIRRRR